MRKQVSIVIYVLMMVFLAGCWDEVPIENHGFVIGSALDLEGEDDNGNPRLSLTNQIVVPSGLGAPGDGGGGGASQEAYTNIQVFGDSALEMSREMANILGREPFYEHLQIVVISDDIAREEQMIGSLMDVFIRDHEMRRENHVIISEGRADEIFNIEPDTEDLPVMYIKETLDSTKKTIEAVKPLTVGHLQGFLLDQDSYAVPKVTPVDNDKGVNSSGVAVFQGHNNLMVGTLDAEETKGLNLIKENLNGGIVKFEVGEELMIFEIEQTKSNTVIDVHDGQNIDIAVTIEAEGRIGEMFGSKSLLDPEYFKEIEEAISREIEKFANLALEKSQKELEVDVFEFGDLIRQRHFSTWKKIEEDWDTGDNIFANSDVSVSANTKVRTTGASDKVKERGSVEE